MPATNDVFDRSGSGMRRIKTYLRTSMTQSHLSNVMVIHIHKDMTESINNVQVLNEFANENEQRIRHFWMYLRPTLLQSCINECWVIIGKYSNFVLSQCYLCLSY